MEGKCLVTGVAGFIGSHLGEKLIDIGYEVIGVDGFISYYSREIKERNLTKLMKSSRFKFIEGNLLDLNLISIISDMDYIFHQAAQAGVRTSWGADFYIYTENNIRATQYLLESCKNKKIKKFIYASSSSIYGNCVDIPMRENSVPLPVSPYGVTKLAGEQLCYLYWKNYGIPVISLRYFTVYGPRQRPDMAFHRFTKAILEDKEIIVYGDGEQTRDFTYIDDIVNANILAMINGINGNVYNIGGGSRIDLNNVIKLLEIITGKLAKIKKSENQYGDMRDTLADITKAKMELGYNPVVKIEEGLEKEYIWMKEGLLKFRNGDDMPVIPSIYKE
jgi:UDP-glucose 4-epimerase